jgi:hypothetical protein
MSVKRNNHSLDKQADVHAGKRDKLSLNVTGAVAEGRYAIAALIVIVFALIGAKGAGWL